LIAVVEEYLQAGLPTDVSAMLIMDVDGFPQGLDAQLDDIGRVLERFAPTEVKVARTAEERDQLWLARRSAGPALGRASPNEYGLDVGVPLRLPGAVAAVPDSARHGLRVTIFGRWRRQPTSRPAATSRPGEAERVHSANGGS
jgi:FAD/FMN-containing dehydrogenase